MSTLLQHAPTNQKFLADITRSIIELEDRIKQFPLFQAAKAAGTLTARESGEFFTQAIQAMEEAYSRDLNAYSAMRWMYYFRRTPNAVFAGDLISTGPNARALAEVYANRSVKLESAAYGSKGFVFPINESTLRHIARFIAFINIIYDLQVGFKLASKEYSFTFPTERYRAPSGLTKGALAFRPMASPAPTILPSRVSDPILENAVRIYDQRHDSHGRTFHGAALNQAGLAHDESANNVVNADVNFAQAYWGLLSEEIAVAPQEFLKGHPRAADYGSAGKVLIRFRPSTLDLAKIFELHRAPALEKQDIEPNASLCLLVLLITGRYLQRSRYSILRIMELGYSIMPFNEWNMLGEKVYDAVCDEVRQHLPQFQAPASFEAFSSSCLSFLGEVWPAAHGAPARKTNDYMCIDMWAASMGFLAWFNIPKTQGKVANERAEKFEDVVQQRIDRTRWADNHIRELRQRTLKVAGQAVTDIDAIGSFEGTLLLVSCKSIPYTREYDQGVHSVIRNAATTVNCGVNTWVNIVNRLSENPSGDNFDFTKYERIVGVVCTPFAVYTSDEKSLSTSVGTLRWACSLDELIAFLEG